MKLEALSQSDIGDKPHTVPYNGILFGHGWNIDNDVGIQEIRIERETKARIQIDLEKCAP